MNRPISIVTNRLYRSCSIKIVSYSRYPSSSQFPLLARTNHIRCIVNNKIIAANTYRSHSSSNESPTSATPPNSSTISKTGTNTGVNPKIMTNPLPPPPPRPSSFASRLQQRMSSRGPVSWMSLFLVGVSAASAVAYYQIERERRLENAMGRIVSSESDGWSPSPRYYAKRKFVPTKYGWFPMEDAFGAPGKPAIGGPWSAVDMNGNLVTNKSFEGKWLLLYFGFARCPDICPSEMLKVGRTIDKLKEERPDLAANLVPIFVSIDPARDSIKALTEYAKDFHPDFVFLTGTPTQIKDMAKKYRVYFSKADESSDGDYLVDHSIVIYFHDNTGDLADCFTQSMRPSDLVKKIVERMTAKPKVMV